MCQLQVKGAKRFHRLQRQTQCAKEREKDMVNVLSLLRLGIREEFKIMWNDVTFINYFKKNKNVGKRITI